MRELPDLLGDHIRRSLGPCGAGSPSKLKHLGPPPPRRCTHSSTGQRKASSFTLISPFTSLLSPTKDQMALKKILHLRSKSYPDPIPLPVRLLRTMTPRYELAEGVTIIDRNGHKRRVRIVEIVGPSSTLAVSNCPPRSAQGDAHYQLV